MPVHKRLRGKKPWFYQFDVSGSSRTNRERITGSGFATKQAAIDAQRRRHLFECVLVAQQDMLIDAALGLDKLPDGRTLIERLRVA